MTGRDRSDSGDGTAARSGGGWPAWLCETVDAVHQTLDRAETAAGLGTTVPDSVTANQSVVFAWVATVEGDHIRVRSAPSTASLPPRLAVTPEGTLTERAELTSEVQVQTDTTPEDVRLALDHAGEQPERAESSVAVPLRTDESSYGVLHLTLSVADPNRERVLTSLGRTLGRQFRAFESADQLARERRRLESTRSLLSHDLGNPLNIASGRVELARVDDDVSHLDSVEGALDRMDELAQRAVRLVEVGQQPVETEPISLAALARESWDDVSPAWGELVVEDATVLGERERVRMLLNELLRNAVLHSDGSVIAEVSPLDDREGFSVEDDGPGIPADEREYVLDTGYTTASDREGLGLSIVSEIAGAHGWGVSLEPGEPGGTRVEIVTSQW